MTCASANGDGLTQSTQGAQRLPTDEGVRPVVPFRSLLTLHSAIKSRFSCVCQYVFLEGVHIVAYIFDVEYNSSD